MNWKLPVMLVIAAPLITACGGGGGGSNDTAVANGVAPGGSTTNGALCPTAVDYNTVYTGGAGDGELVKVQIDTTKLTWQITYVESPIPATPGTVQPTRAGTTVTGTLTPETLLPTQVLNQCAYRLNGASLDPTRIARVFVGEGVMGGTIPGAEISFGGVLGVGQVPDTTFPYYPFIAFSSIQTNIANVAGTYNQLGFHEIPSQDFAQVPVDSKITINADGTWSECDSTGINAGKCQQPGTNLAQSADGSGAFETDNFLGQAAPTSAVTPAAKGFMIVGQLRNQLVPILIRTGYASSTVTFSHGIPQGPVADDESGISILAPQSAIADDSQDGEYIGVDNQFDYRTTALEGTEATLLDPFNPSQASLATALNLDYTGSSVPGVVTSTHMGASSTPTGQFIFTGGVYGFLDMSTPAAPYFTIGAFVQ
jgi:hypothetical protein